MPSNQQRRDAAKRKLERQLVRRQERNKVRRQRTIIASIVAGVLLVGGAIWLITSNKSSADDSAGSGSTSSSGSTETSESTPTTPCSYAATDQPAAREVSAPTNLNPAVTGTVNVTINFGQGPIEATLDRELAPCAVNAFLSLASQGFYDDTPCHRLTDESNFHILQCGDPSGTGRGGPGFEYDNESSTLKQSEVGTETDAASTDTASTSSTETSAATDTAASDPAATDTASTDTASTDTATTTPSHYPVGTLAMASTAPNGKNGSQFFIVYGDTVIDSTGYTKIGTVDDAGVALVQQIAAKGTVANDQGVNDKPAETVTIVTIVVPAEAVSAEAPPSSTAESTDLGTVPTETVPTDAVPTDTAATDTASTGAAATDTSPPTG